MPDDTILNHDNVDPKMGAVLEARAKKWLAEAQGEIKHPVLVRVVEIALVALVVCNAFLSYQVWRQNQSLNALTGQLSEIENLVRPKDK